MRDHPGGRGGNTKLRELELIRPSRARAAADFTVPGLTGQSLRDWNGKAAHAAIQALLK